MNSVETTLAFVYAIIITCFIIGINSALNLFIRDGLLNNKQTTVYCALIVICTFAVITFAAIALNMTD